MDIQKLKTALLQVCPNSRIIDSLSGNSNKENRRLIMQYVLGRKCTLAECNITNLEKELYRIAGVNTQNNERQCENDFVTWLNS